MTKWKARVLPLASLSFVAYFVFLQVSFYYPREPIGFTYSLIPGGVGVSRMFRNTAASRAGFRVGDRLVAYETYAIESTNDVNLANAVSPLGAASSWLIERDGARLTLTAEPMTRAWNMRVAPIMLAMLTFALSLGLGLLVAWRGPGDATSWLGAWLLASLSCVCLPIFPRSMAAAWRDLPVLAGAAMWPAAISSLGTHVMLFAFCARVATPHWSLRRLMAWSAPGIAIWVYLSVFVVLTVYAPARAFDVPIPPWFYYVGPTLYPVYFFASANLLAAGLRSATDLNHRRKLRTLLLGVVCGALGVLVFGGMITFQQIGEARLLSGPLAVVLLLFPVLPLSFAYAALRQRLFDIRVIVRIGLQYALARGMVLALVPITVAGLVIDLVVHGDQPLLAILAERGWTYGSIIAIALVIYSQRQSWMTALDRRFFRERYAAQQILKEVVEDIRNSNDLDTAAAKVVSRIDSALHPKMVAVMKKPRSATAFTSPRLDPLNSSNAIARVVRALNRPVSFGTSGLRDLPEGDKQWLQRSDVELVVPIASDESEDEALLVLGPKKSEEPYAPDDLDLLGAIAASLSMVIGRSKGSDPSRGSDPSETRTAAADSRRLANRYRLQSVLGEGGMGVVYEALDETLGRQVAVKLMRDEQLKGAGGLERFQREARAAASLTHPHIVTVHDFGVDAGEPYLVMERLSGRSLRSALHQEKRLPLARALRILEAVVSAIEAAHARGIIHRDLKPENVFLTQIGSGESAKVLDFGIAKIATGGELATNTSTGIVVGTLPYMSPEQIGGGKAGPSWDAWSLAVIAYEMLSGVHPFKEAAGGSGLPITNAPKIRIFASDLPEKTEACFENALSLDSARRTKSAKEFVELLKAAV